MFTTFHDRKKQENLNQIMKRFIYTFFISIMGIAFATDLRAQSSCPLTPELVKKHCTIRGALSKAKGCYITAEAKGAPQPLIDYAPTPWPENHRELVTDPKKGYLPPLQMMQTLGLKGDKLPSWDVPGLGDTSYATPIPFKNPGASRTEIEKGGFNLFVKKGTQGHKFGMYGEMGGNVCTVEQVKALAKEIIGR